MSISRLKYTLELKIALCFSVICMAVSDQMIDDKTLTLKSYCCLGSAIAMVKFCGQCNRPHCFK
jgi:hypothetical protein